MKKEQVNYNWLLGEINSQIEKVKEWSDPDLRQSTIAALSWVIDKINERRLPTRTDAWLKRSRDAIGYLTEGYEVSFYEGLVGRDRCMFLNGKSCRPDREDVSMEYLYREDKSDE